jgi:hypothetical protein
MESAAMRRLNQMLALLIVLVIPAAAGAQTPEGFEWFPGGTYDPAIPTPADFLGYEIGNDYTSHQQLKAYLEAVAAASDRVTIRSYGKTYEGRDLLLLTITSAENRPRVEDTRLNLSTLADPRGVDQSHLDEIIQNSPAVAWLSYNVHGSESCGTEAAILTVYQLAAGTDAVTLKLLDELVTIIDPLANPDGRERVVSSFHKRLGATYNANPDAWEHGSDWPGGRTNHFMFDLNRDWAWLTQIETQQRAVELLRWNPVVHVDFHEMGGESYFFFPAAKPVHKAIPDVVMKWTQKYGEGNAAAFDEFGWPYYTKIGFDMFYPGFGDSWPSMMGAIGMTYEQGGGGGVAIAVDREDGTTHSLRQRAHGHFTTSIATLKTTADNREERLRDFLAFFRHALSLGDGEVKAYALVPGTDPYNAERLVSLMTRQGMEVRQAGESFRARVARDFGVHEASGAKDFPAGTYVALASQPKGVMLQMLMEPMPALEDTFFYDLSGWALPLLHNVEAYMLGEVPRVRMRPVTDMPEREGSVEGEPARYAYAIPYDGASALFASVDLLNRGVKIRSAGDSFTSNGRTYPAGSFVIPVYRNDPDGAGSHNALKKPRIAVAGGESAGGFGEAWHFFDQYYPYFDFTIVDASRLGGATLEDYDVLILPSGNYSTTFGEQGVENLRSWLQAGGVVVAFDASAQFLGQDGSGITGLTSGGAAGGGRRGGQMGGGPPSGGQQAGGQQAGGQQAGQRQTGGEEPAITARRTLAEREHESTVSRRPGGMYEIVLDPDHWMAFGMPEQMAVLKRSGRTFNLSTRGVNVAVFTPDPLLSGYAPPDWPETLSRGAWLVVENVGRGKAIMFADNVLWRMLCDAEHQFVLNAIVLGPGY